MIDNAVFLIVLVLAPWLCYMGAKIDDKEIKAKEAANNEKKS